MVTENPPDTAAQEFREGDCIVMSQYQGPGAIWFRISRGWINGYGSEVPADWPTNPGAVLIARDGKPVTERTERKVPCRPQQEAPEWTI